jgi:hypothetical protein
MAHIIPKIPQQLLLLSTTASTTQETNKKSTDQKKKKKKKKWIDRFAMENCCCGWGGFFWKNSLLQLQSNNGCHLSFLVACERGGPWRILGQKKGDLVVCC